jgi:acetyl-CoA synthetase
MPLSMLFGPDALEYRLQDSEARAGHRRRERHHQPAAARRQAAPRCRHVIGVGAAAGQGDIDWDVAAARPQPPLFDPSTPRPTMPRC